VAWDAGILTRYHPDPYYNEEKHYPKIKPLYAAPVPPVLRDLSDEELFEAAFDFDCGTNGENKMWLLNHPDHLRWLHDNIIKAAREAV
jgi:hypothetical protein